MSLMTQGDVVRRVQALLDDPAGRRFKPNYLAPYVDQENEDLLTLLEKLGAQMQEQWAVINLPPAVSTDPVDLAPYYGAGQPLQYLMRPKMIKWKMQGQPDTAYQLSSFVSVMDDVPYDNYGCAEYTWTGGTVQVTPSFTALTLKIYFDAVATSIYDPSSNIMRGIGNLLALKVARFVCAANNDMGKLGAYLDKKTAQVKRNLVNVFVMQAQTENKFPRGTKRGAAAQISAGGVPYV